VLFSCGLREIRSRRSGGGLKRAFGIVSVKAVLSRNILLDIGASGRRSGRDGADKGERRRGIARDLCHLARARATGNDHGLTDELVDGPRFRGVDKRSR